MSYLVKKGNNVVLLPYTLLNNKNVWVFKADPFGLKKLLFFRSIPFLKQLNIVIPIILLK